MKQSSRSKFRQRLDHLFGMPLSNPNAPIATLTSLESNWAKYLCVLASGYLEQSIKEILIDYATRSAQPQIVRYIDKSWSNSKNMKWNIIVKVLDQCSVDWGKNMKIWFDADESRKSHINSLVSWRNDIAHGNDANTTGVTMYSVGEGWKTAKKTIQKVEEIVGVNS